MKPVERMHRESVSTLFGDDANRSDCSSEHVIRAIVLGGKQDQSKKLFYVTERCNGLLKLRHYAECIPLLEQLLTIEQNPWFKLRTQLRLTECAIRCDMKQRAELELKNTKRSARRIADLELQDIVSLAQEYESQKLYIGSLLLHVCAADVLKNDFHNNGKISVTECFIRVRNMAQLLKTNLDEAKSLTSVISADCLSLILHDMRTNGDLCLEACVEAVCVNNIGIILSVAGKLRDAESHFLRALKLMEDKYPQKTSKYLVYGNLLSNLGRVSMSFGYLTEAKTYFMKSIMAWNLAENFPNEAQRLAQISSTISKVELVEKQLDGK